MSTRFLIAPGLSSVLLLAGAVAAAAEPGGIPIKARASEISRQRKGPREQEIERRLRTPVTLNFKDAPLRQVLDHLRTCYHLNVYLDEPALAQDGIAPDSPISVTFDQISLRSALKLLLREVQLTYIIRDEVLVVTTPAHTMGPQQRATYQVADLVIPTSNAGDVSPVNPTAAQETTPAPSVTRQQVKTTEESLIRLITSTVEPGSWSDMGGPGTIEYFPLTMSLVINQTPEVQEQVIDLLAALRRLQDQQVAVEVRFVTISENFERVGVDFDLPGRPAVVFLNDAQVSRFMKAAQGDCRTNVMQAPKITTFNGQAANLDITDRQNYVTGVNQVEREGQVMCEPRTETFSTGLRLSVRPVISADRRAVSLTVSASLTNLDTPAVPLFPVEMPVPTREADGSPGRPVVFRQFIQQPKFTTLALDRTLKIPDGQTALLSGWTQERETRNEYGPPVLSKIPYVNRLFNNVGYARTREHCLVLVTPRIIVQEEEEVRQTGYSATPATKEDPVKQKAAELMKRFNTLFKEGKYHEAEVCATAAHVLAPQDPVAVAGIQAARKQGGSAPSAEKAPVSECPCLRKTHRRPREMQEGTPR
jgi:general secretion pathway protein D